MLWRLQRSGKRSSMRFPPGTLIRVAMKFGLLVLRPFIDMSLAFRSGLMATAMGLAASPISDNSGSPQATSWSMREPVQTTTSADFDLNTVIHDQRLNVCFRDHASAPLMAATGWGAEGRLLRNFRRKWPFATLTSPQREHAVVPAIYATPMRTRKVSLGNGLPCWRRRCNNGSEMTFSFCSNSTRAKWRLPMTSASM